MSGAENTPHATGVRNAVAWVLAAGCAAAAAAEISVDLLTTGPSSWISISTGDTPTRAYYFNKIPLSVYAGCAGFEGYVSVPLQWTVRTVGGRLDDQLVRLADVNLYVGRRFGAVEPRAGARIPTGYRTDRVWVGSRNVRLQAGLAVNSNLREADRVVTSGEVMVGLYLPGRRALAEWKSWDIIPSFKTSYRARDAVRIGLEILGSFQSIYWAPEWRESGVGVVPNAYFEIRLSPRFYLVPKAGFGPTFKKTPHDKNLRHTSNAVNLSLGVSFYP